MIKILILSCHWKPLDLFASKKKNWKRVFNTNSELSQNRTEQEYIDWSGEL